MKRLSSILTVILSASAVFSLATACVEEVPEVVDELDLRACLTPSSTSASIDRADGKTVTFTWSNSRGASGYTVEVFEGAETADPETVFADNEPARTYEVPAVSDGKTTTSLKQTLDMDRFYFARVRAESDAKEPSQWAVFPYPIATYDVKPDVKSIEVRDRTSASITIAFTLPEGDADADQLRISPNTFDDSGMEYYKYMFSEHNVSVTAGGTVEVEVEGLDPSVKYTLAVHYGSANRGEVSAWTKPSLEDATPVNTSEALVQALADGAREILVAYSETPYVISTIEGENVTDTQLGLNETKEINVYGDGTADGKMPTIIGRFTVPEGLASLHLEGLNFDGQDYALSHTIQIGEKVTTDITSISMLNCTVTGYKHGFFYYSNEVNSTAGIGKLSFSNIMVTDVAGDGGNGFDIRQACTIGDISITESTFSEGFRTFMRIDAATVATLKFNNNTLNHLCHIENGNNKGLFYIGSGKGNVVIPTFEMNKNVFLNMNGNATRTVFFSDEKGVPTKMSNNFYYRLGEGFWAPEELNGEKINVNGKGKLTQSQGLAGGGAILSADPCVNSEDGILNINSSSAAGVMVLDAKAGDPRWFAEYVPEPLPELEPVVYESVWTLDQETFDSSIDESTVIANTEFYIQENPIRVTDKGFEFTAEATLSSSGVPSDCAMGFLIDGPGSVVLSTERSNSGTANDHISVALGDAEGAAAEVMGAAYAGASGVKVALPNILPGTRQKVYIYACGPVVLTALSWIESTDTGETPKLATPVVSIDNPSVDDTFEGNVTISWPAVPFAASYELKINDQTISVPAGEASEDVTYTLTPSSMEPGTYTITVQALKDENDPGRENSDVSEPVIFTLAETLKQVSASVPTSWGAADFEYLFNTKSAGSKDTEVKEDFVYNNLYYLNGGGKCKFGQDENAAGVDAYRYQFGGSGSTTNQALQFIASGNGTLTIEAASSGTNKETQADSRYVGVSVGEAQIVGDTELALPAKGTDAKKAKILNVTVTANAGDRVSIYSLGSGINVFSLTWTPEGYDPDATIPSDASAIEEQYDFLSGFTADVEQVLCASGQEPQTINKVTYKGSSSKDMLWDGDRIKFQGKSKIDEDTGIPTENYISFKITKPGIIKHYIRSGGNESSADYRTRTVNIDMVMNEGKDIVNLYSQPAPVEGYKSGSEISTEITKEHLAATKSTVTIYISSPVNGVNVYYLEYIPAE